ncbi:helix-turn-helix domain-containing protein [Allorhizocola rhizosphaerae]|uniref:helix-turn-helix domain-containing protein n=1 Tax=Allorhizocola rhizosphaerae TaxID=1872709 RepID=UPI0013C2A36B|nr:helix-turn-helix transcriptional regulator [Allorhizocola rhizosphaerae]
MARRRLRLALRHAREEKGFTQGQVAAALEWSLSKVQRIESGDVTVSRTDLTALLDHLGVTDPDSIGELIEIARTSRRKGWWDDPHYRQHLTPATMRLLQFESEATAIRIFQPTLIPGLIQTPAYAQAVLHSWQDELSDEDRAVRFEVRMRRREYVFDREHPPRYLLVLDESVLLREVGGPRVMAEQLNHLLAHARDGYLTMRIVPFQRSAPIAMLNHFSVIDLGEDENAVLYREAQLTDEIDESPEDVQRYRARFERMWDVALSQEASVRRVEARVADILSSLDRDEPLRSDT